MSNIDVVEFCGKFYELCFGSNKWEYNERDKQVHTGTLLEAKIKRKGSYSFIEKCKCQETKITLIQKCFLTR